MFKNKKTMPFGKQGFTLLEILLVVAAIAILAGIVIIAINPGKQLAETRDAQRWSDVNAILNGVYQYSIDNDGILPTGISTTGKVIGLSNGGCGTTCTAENNGIACLDLKFYLVPNYLVAIPMDPSDGRELNSDYYIKKDADGRIVVGACDPEEATEISVTR